jgi:hypothetical protein
MNRISESVNSERTQARYPKPSRDKMKNKKENKGIKQLTICGSSLATTLLPPNMVVTYLLGFALSLFGTESDKMDAAHTGDKEK